MKQLGRVAYVPKTEIEKVKPLLLEELIEAIKKAAKEEDFWNVKKLDGTFPWYEGSEDYAVFYKICIMSADDETEQEK